MNAQELTNPTIQRLLEHRSIRRYQDRPLPEGLLERLIACGQKASTSSNMQAYSIIHVSEKNRKTELAKLCADQIQIHQSAAFLVFCADLHRLEIAQRIRQNEGENERFRADYMEALLVATVDTALVMQNVAVAAESVGLGICMIGAIRNQPKAVGRLLKLPSFVYAVAGFCIGYPADQPPSKPRLPIEAVLHREGYMDDALHKNHLDAYDETMVEFYTSQQMHSNDPRWTQAMAGRVGGFAARAELGVFLREQGFRQKWNS